MKKSERAGAKPRRTDDVRVLAKERARRRARISKRGVNKQRGALGGVVIGIVTVVAWVLAPTANLAIAVPAVFTALAALYAGGFGYIVKTMAQATAADEAAIEKLNVKMRTLKGSSHVAGSRRPVVRRPGTGARGKGRASAGSAASAVSARSAASSDSADAAGTSVTVSKAAGVKAGSAGSSSQARVKSASAASASGTADTASRTGGSAGRIGGSTSRTVESPNKAVRNKDSQISISVSPEIVEDTVSEDLTLTSSASEAEAKKTNAAGPARAAEAGSVRRVAESADRAAKPAERAVNRSVDRAVTPGAVSASVSSASGAESGEVAAATASPQKAPSTTSAAGSVARGTARAKQEPIKRRVVTPYEAPEAPSAAVPYRPKDVDEHFDANKLSSPTETSAGSQGLSGGSALDALLARRRA